MEHFFHDDDFCSDLDDLARIFDIEEDNINELDEDWKTIIELSDLEPIFSPDAEELCHILANFYEDRLTEEFGEEARVLKALKECIDFEKLKETLPKLYYPNGVYEKVTKSDLVDWFN
jgi:hypothetical protein